MKRCARLEWERHKSSRTKKKCFHQAKSHCQSLLREVENTWWKEKAQEIQNYANNRDLKNFYNATKQLYGPTPASAGALLADDNTTVLTDPLEILERWKQDFETLLNRTTTPAVDYLANKPQHKIQHWMSLPPTYNAFQEALR